MNPPKPGDPSYEQFARERDAIIEVRRCSATLPPPQQLLL